MIFPVSHDRDTLTRWPVVTLGLVALCLIVHLWVELADDPYAQYEEAISYYFEHPYLEPDEELWGGEVPELGGNVTLQDLFEGPDMPSPLQVAREQERLDVLTAAWVAARDSQPFQRFGLVPANYEVYHLITFQFLHGGWLHLLGNVFLLYFAGAPLEDRWGRPVTLGFFLAAGAVAALVYASTYPESAVPLVGASGGVAGVFGACAVRFWNTRIKFAYFFFLVFRVYAGTFRAPAWLMLPIWLLGEVYSSYVSHVMMDALPDGGGVAYLAHVGGFVFGAGLALVIMMTGLNEKLKGSIHKKIGLEENPAIDEAYQAQMEGDSWTAREMIRRQLAEDPTQRDLIRAYWDMSVQLEETAPAVRRFCWLIQQELREGDSELGLQHWDELKAYAPKAQVPPALTVLVIETYVADHRLGEAREVVRALDLAAVGAMPPMLVPRLLAAVEDVDKEAALRVASAGLTHSELDAEQRAHLEGRVRSLEAHIDALRTATPVVAPSMPAENGGAAAPPNKLTVTAAVPERMDDQSLWLQVAGKGARLGMARIRSIGVGYITASGLYVLDLIVGIPETDECATRTVRCRTDQWDPRGMVPDESELGRALLTLTTRLQSLSRSRVIPAEPSPFQLQPFAEFGSVEAYERAMLSSLSTG